jgi:hypothetical protein
VLSSVLTLLLVTSGVALAADLAPGGTFTDDDGLVHEPYIEALAAAGLTNGCGSGTYCPARAVSRAELAAFVLRAAGISTDNQGYGAYFTDVGPTAWYTRFVERAFELGFMSRYDDQTFKPDALVNRASFAEVLLTALGEEVVDEPRNSYFSDVAAAFRYRPHIDRLYELGITQGCRSTPLMYCPNEYITRAELASFLGRGFGLAPLTPPGATTTTTTTTLPTTTTDCPPTPSP